jgi:AraC-like DNA-binding protein
MRAVAALLERRPALLALRRALPRAEWPLFTARSPAHLTSLLQRHCFDAIFLGADAARGTTLDALRRDFPTVPLIVYLHLRSDDAELLRRLHHERVASIAVEGLDEPILTRIVAEHGVTARRRSELLPLAPLLDLTDPLQRAVWDAIVTSATVPIDTAQLAARFSLRRETLSRRFAAGGAPSLKRAIDVVRLVAAAQLLGSPGYRVEDAARLLGYSSVSLLQQTARRTLGVAARQVGTLDAARIAERLRADQPAPRWR